MKGRGQLIPKYVSFALKQIVTGMAFPSNYYSMGWRQPDSPFHSNFSLEEWDRELQVLADLLGDNVDRDNDYLPQNDYQTRHSFF